MELREREGSLRAVDESGTTLTVSTDGWESARSESSVSTAVAESVVGPDELDATRTGKTRGLEFPYVHLTLVDRTTGELIDLSSVVRSEGEGYEERTRRLPAGRYLLVAETNVRSCFQFDGAVRVSRVPGEWTRLTFAEPTVVSFGVESSVETVPDTVTVPRTPAGMATAVTHFAAGADVQTADRSWVTTRGPPPTVQWGSETHVPESVREATPTTAVELTLPADPQSVCVAGPLAYYLGATVETVSGATPKLDLPTRSLSLGADSPVGTHDSVEREGTAALASRLTRLLQRGLYGDCVVRGFGDYSDHLSSASQRETLGLDDPELFDAPLGERVERYLAVDFTGVSELLPAWPLSLSVGADGLPVVARTAHYLPALAPTAGEWHSGDDVVATAGEEDGIWPSDDWGRPAVIDVDGGGEPTPETTAPADATDTAPETTVPTGATDTASETTAPTGARERSDGGVRSVGTDTTTVDDASGRVASRHDWGRFHGRVGSGPPVEGFHAHPAGFGNRDRFVDEESPLRIVAVSCVEDAPTELSAAVERYSERADELALDVEVVERPTVARLARVFERESDHLHLMAHRSAEGIVCADGVFSPTTLSASNARTFLLNACRSHADGIELIERGSVAGVVTCRDVLDEMAAEVGAAFAHLLAEGFCVVRAAEIARERASVPSDYVAVGDGTHRVTQTSDVIPKVLLVGPADETGVCIQRRRPAIAEQGAEVVSPDETARLAGAEPPSRVDRGTLEKRLTYAPVVAHDGRYELAVDDPAASSSSADPPDPLSDDRLSDETE